MKTCTKCGEEKEFSEFSKREASFDGLSYVCKACDRLRKQSQAYRDAANAARRTNEHRKSRRTDSHRNACKEYRNSHIDYFKEYFRSDAYKLKAKLNRQTARSKLKKRESSAKGVRELSNDYIVKVIRIPISLLTPELIELKREQLLMHRATKQLTKEIENGTK